MVGTDRFTCKLCGERFEERDALVEHGLEAHRKDDEDRSERSI